MAGAGGAGLQACLKSTQQTCHPEPRDRPKGKERAPRDLGFAFSVLAVGMTSVAGEAVANRLSGVIQEVIFCSASAEAENRFSCRLLATQAASQKQQQVPSAQGHSE